MTVEEALNTFCDIYMRVYAESNDTREKRSAQLRKELVTVFDNYSVDHNAMLEEVKREDCKVYVDR